MFNLLIKLGETPFLFLFFIYIFLFIFKNIYYMPTKFKIPSTVNGRKYKYMYPDTRPIIYGLSQNSSVLAAYTVVYLSGYNFSKSNTTGNSTVTFGNITNIPVTFYSSLNISFVVPFINLTTTTYTIQVVNNNYFPVTQYSNKVNYTLT